MKKKITFLPVLAVFLAIAVVPVSAARPVKIIKGPYLQQVTPNSIVIMWETNTRAASRVDYGLEAPGEFHVEDSTKVTIHEVQLTNLAVDTEYSYTVTSVDRSKTVTSAESTFATAPDGPRNFRFVAYGDTRTNENDHAAVIQGIISTPGGGPEFVLHTGDLVSDGDNKNVWGPEFFAPAYDLMINTPLLPVIGNHEASGNLFRDLFSLGDNDVGDNDDWFAFTYGGVRFIGLNTHNASYSPTSTQYNWLVSELVSSEYNNATWHIVYFHHPPYTATSSHSDEIGVQEHLVPLFEEYGVDMVFNGHSHAYERYFNNGVYYIVTGGGGAPLASLIADTVEPIREFGKSAYHHCVIDVDVAAKSLILSARDNYGVEFDTISLIKTEKASNPSPGNGAAGVAIDADLSWTAGIDAVSHDVYFGTNPGNLPQVSTQQAGTTYDPGTLAQGTTYYWAIDEHDSSGAITYGDVWSFTTGVPPLVPEGADWKYFDHVDSDQGAWFSTLFDDGSWASGPAELGYGDGDEATGIYTGNREVISSYYFRHTFNSPAAYDNLTLNVVRDDGCVVYLNGVEIGRSNMPGGTIYWDTWAAGVTTNENSWWDIPIDSSVTIQPGINVLAVSVHQAHSTSSDVSFDLELLGVEAVVGQPVANDDSDTTDEDTPVVIDVLANDTDPEEDTLSVASVTQPSNGTVVNNGSDVTYTPDENFNGVDTFAYTATDGTSSSNSATVTVTVNAINDAPVANDDAYSTEQNTPLSVAAPGVLDNDTDADGNPLTAMWVSGPSNGSLVLNADGSFTYTPNPTFVDSDDSFTYVANDGTADSAVATVTVTVNPVAGDVVTITKAEYKAAKSELNVEATSSEGGTAVLTVVGYGQMTYDSRKNIHKLKIKPVADPGGTVTVTSSEGGSDASPVTYK